MEMRRSSRPHQWLEKKCGVRKNKSLALWNLCGKQPVWAVATDPVLLSPERLMWYCVSLDNLWSHQAENCEPALGQHRGICPAWGGATQPGFPQSPACQSPEAGQAGLMISSLPRHRCKYICLSALLTAIREERGRRIDQDRDTDSGAAVWPRGRKSERQREVSSVVHIQTLQAQTSVHTR